VDAAVRRVLEAKQLLGLFDDPYRKTDIDREKANELSPDARALAREAGRESIVLLKNDGNLLPLSKKLAKLAVIGELAVDKPATLGTWHGAGRFEDTVTVLEGIQAVLPKAKVVYARGASPWNTATTGFDEAERAARGADVVLLVVGEGGDMSGEARSRSSIALPGGQQALFERLRKLGKPLVVLLINGRALAVPEVAEHAPAILEAWQLGHEMGNAVADVVFGDVAPSGKLPVTFPRTLGQVPLYYNHKQTGRPPQERERYTSKYIDVPWTPQFPFGYGLSYTTFSYGEPQLSATTVGPTASLSVSVNVKNTGERVGTEVVQLYLRDDAATFTRPVRALRGFRRVTLPPGGAEDVQFTLDADDFALLDENFARVVEAGTFTVFVGGSSEATNQASFEVSTGAKLQGPGSAIPRALR
jgi:beta-glucosidase